MSHQLVGPYVLLPRLLAAIGAGSLLAGPGCGAKSNDRSDAVINGVSGQQSEGQMTRPGSAHTSDATMHPTSLGSSTSSATTNYIETVSPETVVVNPTSSQQAPSETTSSIPTNVTVETVLTDAGAIDGGSSTNGPTCDYGDVQEFCLDRSQMETQARFGVGDLQPTEPLRSEAEIAAGFDENGCLRHEWIASGCCNKAIAAGKPQENGTCCYAACEGACCGRPFIVNGLATVASVVERKDWLLHELPWSEAAELQGVTLSPDHAMALAGAWLSDAQMEHASVASFSQFSFDLMQLGAPPELLRDCHRACLDEIEHARIGFSVASQLAGITYGPGSLRMGAVEPRSLAEVLTAVIHEGCIGETLAAGIVAEQARVCSDPTLAAHLNTIAEDELRHSELAWRFVAWALGHFGVTARVVVEATFARALTQLPAAPVDLGLPLDVLHHGGRLTQAEWVNASQRVFDEVLTPAVAALLGGTTITRAQQRTALAVS